VLGFELLEEVGTAIKAAQPSRSALVPATAPASPPRANPKKGNGGKNEEAEEGDEWRSLATNSGADPYAEEATANDDPYAEDSALEQGTVTQGIRRCFQAITTVRGSSVCNDASIDQLYDSISSSSSELEWSVQEVLRTTAGPRVFTNEEMASIRNKLLSSSSTLIPTGLKWLVLTMNVLRMLKPAWNEGTIFGIISKEETFELLKTQPVGTALLRFSDSSGGTLAVAFRDVDTAQGAPKITHRQVGVFVDKGAPCFKILKVPRYANQTFEQLADVIDCLPCTTVLRPQQR
jgi:hypothetical protein